LTPRAKENKKSNIKNKNVGEGRLYNDGQWFDTSTGSVQTGSPFHAHPKTGFPIRSGMTTSQPRAAVPHRKWNWRGKPRPTNDREISKNSKKAGKIIVSSYNYGVIE